MPTTSRTWSGVDGIVVAVPVIEEMNTVGFFARVKHLSVIEKAWEWPYVEQIKQ